MNAHQQAMYFAEWGKLRDVLRAKGWNNAKIEEHRHAVTVRVLGLAKSSKQFTNGDLDAVLARIKAEREPGNLGAQLDLQSSPEKAIAAVEKRINAAVAVIVTGGDPEFLSLKRTRYVEGTAKRLCPGTPYHAMPVEQLRKVMGALERSAGVKLREQADAAAVEREDPY